MAAPSLAPAQLLARHPAGIRSLAESLRRLVRDAIPEASEYVNAGWGAITYRHPIAGYVCGIFPFTDHVKLLFEHGVELADPAAMLEGDGKQVRYVTVRTPADARRRGLKPLLVAAVALRAGPRPNGRARRVR